MQSKSTYSEINEKTTEKAAHRIERLKRKIAKFIQNYPEITELDLSNLTLTNEAAKFLFAELKQHEFKNIELSLKSTRMNLENMSTLLKLAGVKKLSFYLAEADTIQMLAQANAAVENIPIELKLLSCKLGEADLEQLKFSKIHLSNTSFNDENIAQLARNKSLRKLSFSNSKEITVNQFTLLMASPCIQFLDLRVNAKDKEKIIALAKNNKNLISLKIDGKEIFFANDFQHPSVEHYKNKMIHAYDKGRGSFSTLLLSSEEILNFVLKHPTLLNSIDQKRTDQNQQFFAYSCFAKVILRYLDRKKILPDNLKNELEIYSTIWRKPGAEADIEKVAIYFQKMGINFVTHEYAFTSWMTIEGAGLGDEYDNFAAKMPSRVEESSQFKNLESADDFGIAICINPGGGLHSIAYFYEQGELIVYDPAFGTQEKVCSIQEYFSKRPEAKFTGVTFRITGIQPQHTLIEENDNTPTLKS